ncbi:MAG: hypothetical protein M1825_004123 [Sarcosagium campestre]|nr:MAG: hypothetical protein M1825_004123 [Sarcosagium campestre]
MDSPTSAPPLTPITTFAPTRPPTPAFSSIADVPASPIQSPPLFSIISFNDLVNTITALPTATPPPDTSDNGGSGGGGSGFSDFIEGLFNPFGF